MLYLDNTATGKVKYQDNISVCYFSIRPFVVGASNEYRDMFLEESVNTF